MTDQIRFDDGAGYERYMETWSRLAAEHFLDWLAPEPALRWLDVGCGSGVFLDALDTRAITVQRTFADFDDYWTTVLMGASVGPSLAAMSAEALAQLKTNLRARLAPDASGRITSTARANAIKGRAPR